MNKFILFNLIMSCTLGARITCLTQEDIWCYKTVTKATSDSCVSRFFCTIDGQSETVSTVEAQQEYEHSKQEMSRTCRIFSYDENNL